MISRARLLTLALLFLCAWSRGLGTMWFVNSATGSDSNTGRAAGQAFATLQKAANSVAPGDTVCVAIGSGYGGGTSGTPPLVITVSNTTYTGCVGSVPIYGTPISGSIPAVSSAQGAYVVGGLYPLANITINSLEIIGGNASITWAQASANAVASGTGWQAARFNEDGIFLSGGTSQTLHNFVLSNLLVHDLPLDGIACNFCDYMTVTGSVVHDTGLYSPYAGSGISLYELHNIDAGTGTKNIVSGNLTYANINYIPAHSAIILSTTAIATSSGATQISVASSSGANYTGYVIHSGGCIPQGTEVAYFGTGYIGLTLATTCNISTGDAIQVAYVTDGEGIIIDNNSNSQSDSVAYVGRTAVQNNLVLNNGGAGLECGPQSNNCDFSFNTVYLNQQSQLGNSSAPGEITDYQTNGSNFYNNALVAASNVPSGWDQSTGTTTWSNNSFFGGNASHTLPGSNNVTSNPNFVSPGTNPATANFGLQANSPLINAGSATFTRRTDYTGAYVPTKPIDIGAYQRLP